MISFDFHLPNTLFFIFGGAFCGGNGGRSVLAEHSSRGDAIQRI